MRWKDLTDIVSSLALLHLLWGLYTYCSLSSHLLLCVLVIHHLHVHRQESGDDYISENFNIDRLYEERPEFFEELKEVLTRLNYNQSSSQSDRGLIHSLHGEAAHNACATTERLESSITRLSVGGSPQLPNIPRNNTTDLEPSMTSMAASGVSNDQPYAESEHSGHDPLMGSDLEVDNEAESHSVNYRNGHDFNVDETNESVAAETDGLVVDTAAAAESKVDTATADESKVDTATADESKVDTATADESKVDTATADESKVGTAIADESKVGTVIADESKVDKAISDESKVDTAISDESKVDTAIADEPKVDTAISDESKVDKVTADESKVDTVIADESKVDTATADESKVDTATADESKVDTATADESKVDTAIADESKVGTVIADESKVDTATADESKVDTATADESKVDTATADESKVDTAIADESKVGTVIADESKVDKAISDESKVDTAISDESKVDTAIADEPKVDTAISDESKVDKATADESKVDTVIADESKVDTVIADESKVDTATADESKVDTATADESKVDTAIADESKVGTVIADESKVDTAISDESKVDTAISDESKVDTAIADESKVDTAIAVESKVDTVISDESKVDTAIADESKVDTVISDESEVDTAISDESKVDTAIADEPPKESAVLPRTDYSQNQTLDDTKENPKTTDKPSNVTSQHLEDKVCKDSSLIIDRTPNEREVLLRRSNSPTNPSEDEDAVNPISLRREQGIHDVSRNRENKQVPGPQQADMCKARKSCVSTRHQGNPGQRSQICVAVFSPTDDPDVCLNGQPSSSQEGTTSLTEEPANLTLQTYFQSSMSEMSITLSAGSRQNGNQPMTIRRDHTKKWPTEVSSDSENENKGDHSKNVT